VYLLGGRPGAALEAAERLGREGVRVVGAEGPQIDPTGAAPAELVERIAAARPELLLVGLGSPKQELFIDRHRAALGATVALACGAVIDFIAGHVPRAPQWMARSGLEWAYRLAREPRRLWRRYLVQDPAFAAIVLDTWRQRRRQG